MLAHALMVSQDATVGNWDGTNDNIEVPAFRVDTESVDYLTPDLRGIVVSGEIISNFHVEGGDHKATVRLGNDPVAVIVRPDNKVFHEQMAWVRSYADLRIDRIPEILEQTGDIFSFFGALAHLSDGRRARSLEVMEIIHGVVVTLEMQVKHYCRAARPIDRSMRVQPVIQTPEHSSFPSGHATEAYALATVMSALSGPDLEKERGISDYNSQFFRLAHRIATNRVIAGVHYPVDSAAGAVLGCMLGEAIIALATGSDAKSMTYDVVPRNPKKGGPVSLNGDEDFTVSRFKDICDNAMKPCKPKAVKACPLLKNLWNKARDEWRPAPDVKGKLSKDGSK
ncbi:MAG: phosphatase PAP2 family protein [Pseudomonadota bacterium]